MRRLNPRNSKLTMEEWKDIAKTLNHLQEFFWSYGLELRNTRIMELKEGYIYEADLTLWNNKKAKKLEKEVEKVEGEINLFIISRFLNPIQRIWNNLKKLGLPESLYHHGVADGMKTNNELKTDKKRRKRNNQKLDKNLIKKS